MLSFLKHLVHFLCIYVNSSSNFLKKNYRVCHPNVLSPLKLKSIIKAHALTYVEEMQPLLRMLEAQKQQLAEISSVVHKRTTVSPMLDRDCDDRSKDE